VAHTKWSSRSYSLVRWPCKLSVFLTALLGGSLVCHDCKASLGNVEAEVDVLVLRLDLRCVNGRGTKYLEIGGVDVGLRAVTTKFLLRAGNAKSLVVASRREELVLTCWERKIDGDPRSPSAPSRVVDIALARF